MPSTPRLSLLLSLAVALSACDPAGSGDGDGGTGPGRTTFAWRPVTSTVTPVWGGFVAEGGARPILVGGVAGTSGPVLDSAEIPAFVDDGSVRADEILGLDGPRYCGCAFVDGPRNELVVVGGRDGRFVDAPSSVVVDLDDGAVTAIADVGPAAFPVGCVAFFLPATGRGYVYSGLSSTQRGFGSGLFRWDGDARAFVAVPAAGDAPAPRYDAAVHVMADDTTALVVSGMGLGAGGAPVFHQDVWRFDGASETWTELPTTAPPPGRRYAWSALAPDDDTLIFGHGSDSPQGLTLLADLWRLQLGTGTWTRLDDDDALFEVESALPARGFASRLPGPADSAGLMSGGMVDDGLASDAFVLDVPDALRGTWR